MRSIRDIPVYNDIPIIVRAGLNEPVENGRVADIFRLRRAVPTLKFLASQGARVIAISHIDPPGGKSPTGAETLAPVAEALGQLLSRVSFCPESTGPIAREAVRKLAPGEIVVLENLRRNKGEVANDPAFAAELAQLADVYVEDSFDTCHRPHASIIGLPTLLPSYAGLLLLDEVEELRLALTPKSPSLAVIGGAKFSTKEPVLAKLLTRYDKVFVGGAMANDFLKAQGHPVGSSLVSGGDEEKMRAMMANPKLVLPVDSIVAPTSNAKRGAGRVASLTDVAADEMILDHGPATAALLAHLAQESRSVLWNGPLGNYENGFVDSTNALAVALARSSAYSILGGGDTITAIEALHVLERFSFVSTGGGAMLEFLAKGSLPGIDALG